MVAPLLILAFGAVFAGWAFDEHFVGAGRVEFWNGAISVLPTNHVLDFEGKLPPWEVWAPLTVTAIGFFGALYAYFLKEGLGARIAAGRGIVWSLFYNKWYFDEIYDFLIIKPSMRLGWGLWKGGDGMIIDGLGPNGVAAVTRGLSRRASRLQTGYVYHYAFAMLIGVLCLVSWYLLSQR
jgi:NADH-quinone oxidoreductase subunit L